MKKIIILLSISIMCTLRVDALWINKTMVYGGLTRSYRVYQSPNYNASYPSSLLIALHGLGDNMTNFSSIGFDAIADTANIICIFPQAANDPLAGTAWNSGAGYMGYYPNTTVDDIGFINALIDTAETNYSIDTNRVYLCGFSLGGFMTERMAGQSNTRIAAFVSMSGTIGNGITTFVPGRHIPIAHFHGTADATVAYTGNTYGIDVDSLIHFWIINNECNTTPVIYHYPDIASDNITVDRYEYSNGDPQSDVWFFKMNGAAHTGLFLPGNDISEPIETWLFFRKHTLAKSGIHNINDITQLQVFPNPATTHFTINLPQNYTDVSYTLYDIQGNLQYTDKTTGMQIKLNVTAFPRGIYVLKVITEINTFITKIILQ